jgi:hypothetical protein
MINFKIKSECWTNLEANNKLEVKRPITPNRTMIGGPITKPRFQSPSPSVIFNREVGPSHKLTFCEAKPYSHISNPIFEWLELLLDLNFARSEPLLSES